MLSIKKIFAGFIPRYIPVRVIAVYLRLLSVPMPRSIRKKHLQDNRAAWKVIRQKAIQGGYIENQSLLTGMRFGNAKASFNCCEAIAAANVLRAVANQKKSGSSGAQHIILSDFATVLFDFEQRGLVLGGFFGTATDIIVSYLKDKGLYTEELWGHAINRTRTEQLTKDYDAFVLTMYNDADNIFAQVHTVCITKQGTKYAVHNAGMPGRRFLSLYEAIRGAHKEKGKEILLVGVKGADHV